MLKPAITDLIRDDESKYSLVIATAKRAREIASQAEISKEILIEKAVSIAVNELASKKYSIVVPDDEN